MAQGIYELCLHDVPELLRETLEERHRAPHLDGAAPATWALAEAALAAENNGARLRHVRDAVAIGAMVLWHVEDGEILLLVADEAHHRVRALIADNVIRHIGTTSSTEDT